jgi:hypothetical protein
MRRAIYRTAFALVVALGAGVVLGERGIREREVPSFTVPSDPEVIVLQLAYGGSMSGDSLAYVLYGDGRLVRSYRMAGGELTELETWLASHEVYELVEIAVIHGLAETTQAEYRGKWDDVDRRAREARPRAPGILVPPATPPPADAGFSRIEIHLETFGENGPLTNVLLDSGYLGVYSEPPIPEMAGWKRVAQSIEARFPRRLP